MKAIKAVVAVMGVLLVLGLGLLGYGLFSKARSLAPPGATGTEQGTEQAAPAAGVADFGTVRIDLPPGAQVQSMVGSGSRIVLRVTLVGGEERLVVIDPATGRVTGTIVVGPASVPSPALPPAR